MPGNMRAVAHHATCIIERAAYPALSSVGVVARDAYVERVGRAHESPTGATSRDRRKRTVAAVLATCHASTT